MNFDETERSQASLTQGASLSFAFLPEGNSSGDESFSGSGIVTGMSVGVTLDGVTTRTVSLQGNWWNNNRHSLIYVMKILIILMA